MSLPTFYMMTDAPRLAELKKQTYPSFSNLKFIMLLYAAWLHLEWHRVCAERYPDRDVPLRFLMAHPAYDTSFEHMQLMNDVFEVVMGWFEDDEILTGYRLESLARIAIILDWREFAPFKEIL